MSGKQHGAAGLFVMKDGLVMVRDLSNLHVVSISCIVLMASGFWEVGKLKGVEACHYGLPPSGLRLLA